MKFKTILDAACEEQVLIYAKERTPLVEQLEQLLLEESQALYGYKDKAAQPLDMANVCCFTVEDNKVYAQTNDGQLLLKKRLYELEKMLPRCFIRINQSCIANIRKIKRFDASIAGTLCVTFQNGYTDYVSRRNLKKVKERLGL